MAMTTSRTTLQHVTADATVGKTLALVATMVGLTRETATKIVEAGLPMMANVADENPYIFKAMFARSLQALPVPTAEYYESLGKNTKARQAITAEFSAMYGAVTDALYREAARRANATEEQAGQVLAAAMPAMVKALGLQNTQRNEMGFGRLLRTLNA